MYVDRCEVMSEEMAGEMVFEIAVIQVSGGSWKLECQMT